MASTGSSAPANVLAIFDSNSNGKLDPAERQQLERGLRQIRKEQLAIMDANKDGRIGRDEFEAAKKGNWVEKLSPESKALFKKLDLNRDGWLGAEEKNDLVALWRKQKQEQRAGTIPVSPTAHRPPPSKP